MGAAWCCFHVSDGQNNAGSNNSSSDDCSCPKCLFKRFMNKRFNQSNIRETRAGALPNSSNFQVVLDNSSYARGSNGRSVANIANSGNLQLQTNESTVRVQEKSSGQSRVEPEPERQTLIDQEKSELNEQLSDKIVFTAVKDSSSKVESGIATKFPDDEDVCPTCLEEYTQDNPKTVLKCSHQYHLGCIYEWMERNPRCPICNEMMLFE